MSTNNVHTSRKENAVNAIYSITPFTLLDYPDKTACILWFAGCNMRCLYCYNPDIVLGKGKISDNEALKFISSRKGLLDGVVFSGGESTLHKNIISLATEIKKIGMLIKVDTNGSNPHMIKSLLQNQLVDYIALDFKGTADSYKQITQSDLFQRFEETLLLLLNSTIKFEIRTTVHSELTDKKDLLWMQQYLETKGYRGKYYLQNTINNVPTLGNIENSQKAIDTFNYSSAEKINIVVRN